MYVTVTRLLLKFVCNLKQILIILFRAFDAGALTIGDWHFEKQRTNSISMRLRDGRVVYLSYDAHDLMVIASNFDEFLAFIDTFEQYLKDWVNKVINDTRNTLTALSPYMLSEELGE